MAFDGFELTRIDLGEVTVRLRHGGSGPPLLLLHGCPQTHMMWGKIAGDLAREFTVIAPDLRGYGESSKPEPVADNSSYSKRAMAGDALALMRRFGFERFAVAGHDRGARVAYRLALDHPQAVERISVLDIIPTGEMWARADHRFALRFWFWPFMAQPAPLPETVIGRDPEYFFFTGMFRGLKAIFDPQAYGDYVRCNADPLTVRAICEDYRAGAGFDRRLDLEQRGKRQIACPVQVLWGANSAVGAMGDVLAIWRDWCEDLTGQAIPGGHFLPEESPRETLAALQAFFREGR